MYANICGHLIYLRQALVDGTISTYVVVVIAKFLTKSGGEIGVENRTGKINGI